MRDDLRIRLVKDFPSLYSKGFYFECDDGWHDLLYRMSSQINEYLKNVKEEDWSLDTDVQKEPFKVDQVKEKFGGLRFYVSKTTDEIRNIIDAGERESYRICELCGAPGKIRRESWIRVKCDSCFEVKK